MSKAGRRLGKGLDSLISGLSSAPATSVEEPTQVRASPTSPTVPRTLPVERIQANPFQPRRDIDASDLDALARSIRQSGIVQPIIVRRLGDVFQLIAGERRLRAARLAGLSDVPVVVRDVTDQQMLELALIENIHREDLNPIDRAMAYKQFCEQLNLKSDEAAGRLGEDRSTVANYIRLLSLSDAIKTMVARREISMGHARCLLSISDPRAREHLAFEIIEKQLSVRATEQLVRELRQDDPTRPPAQKNQTKAAPPTHVKALQERLELALQTKVKIEFDGRNRNSGRIAIRFGNVTEFEEILQRMKIESQVD